jgi:hypothetical protein
MGRWLGLRFGFGFLVVPMLVFVWFVWSMRVGTQWCAPFFRGARVRLVIDVY